MTTYQVPVRAAHRIAIRGIPSQLEKTSPDDRRLRGAGHATPPNRALEVRTDATRNETVLVHQPDQAVRGACGCLDEVRATRCSADADQALHRVCQRVEERPARVDQAAIAKPAVAQLPGEAELRIAHSAGDGDWRLRHATGFAQAPCGLDVVDGDVRVCELRIALSPGAIRVLHLEQPVARTAQRLEEPNLAG